MVLAITVNDPLLQLDLLKHLKHLPLCKQPPMNIRSKNRKVNLMALYLLVIIVDVWDIYIKAIKQGRIPKPISSKRFKRTPKSKVEVQKIKKVWIRKSDLSVASTSSKACVAKNMIGEKEMTCRCSHQCFH